MVLVYLLGLAAQQFSQPAQHLQELLRLVVAVLVRVHHHNLPLQISQRTHSLSLHFGDVVHDVVLLVLLVANFHVGNCVQSLCLQVRVVRIVVGQRGSRNITFRNQVELLVDVHGVYLDLRLQLCQRGCAKLDLQLVLDPVQLKQLAPELGRLLQVGLVHSVQQGVERQPQILESVVDLHLE